MSALIMQRLIEGLDGPRIFTTLGNSRADRMAYFKVKNAAKDGLLQLVFKDNLTILARKGRLIVGPKDFGDYLMSFVDIETCSQEELTQAYDLYYPDEIKFNYKSARERWDEDVKREREEKKQAERTKAGSFETMDEKGKEMAIRLGLVKQKPLDPYETYGDKEDK